MTFPSTSFRWDPIVWVEVSAKAIGALMMPTAHDVATVAANAVVIVVIFNVVQSWLVRQAASPAWASRCQARAPAEPRKLKQRHSAGRNRASSCRRFSTGG
jgi:hypothetical protein